MQNFFYRHINEVKLLDIQIVETTENPILRRKEISFSIEEKSMPERVEVKEKLAAMHNADFDLVFVREIKPSFGTTKVSQFEKLQAQAVDSEQIKAWKEELQQLYNKIRPSNKKDTASAPILRDLMLRSFNLQLEFDGIQEHIAKTKDSRDEIAKNLDALLASRNTGGAERWQVQAWRDELSEVERSMAIVQSLQKSNVSDFQIVSPAEASPNPTKSNRRLIAMGVAGMLSITGLGLVLANI